MKNEELLRIVDDLCPENVASVIKSSIASCFNGKDLLTELSNEHGTDKSSHHRYTQHYHRLFSPIRFDRLRVLELGIGGYNHSSGGGSLRMWKRYFPNSLIYGIDIEDKRHCEEERVKVFVGSQDDEAFLNRCLSVIGQPDIIIDDASHINPKTIKTFNLLFPHLKIGGFYAIEDLQTSYWEDFWGVQWFGSTDVNARHTAIAFLKSLVDGLNYEEFLDNQYKPSYFDRHIFAIHFYHNLCILEKRENMEGSIIVPPKSL